MYQLTSGKTYDERPFNKLVLADGAPSVRAFCCYNIKKAAIGSMSSKLSFREILISASMAAPFSEMFVHGLIGKSYYLIFSFVFRLLVNIFTFCLKLW